MFTVKMQSKPQARQIARSPLVHRATTILVVDDSAADRELLRAALEEMGHAAVATADARQALVEARKSRPDVILSGVQLPGDDGFELCRQLQIDPDLRHVPVVFVTAEYRGLQFEEFARDVGAFCVLSKPVAPETLRAAVEESLSVGFVAEATQKLRRLDNESFHQRHAQIVGSQLERKVAELQLQVDLYDALSQTNQAVTRCTSGKELLPAICRIRVTSRRLRFAAVFGRVGADRKIKVAARYGEDADYLNTACLVLDGGDTLGGDPVGAALRSGEPVVNNEFLNDPTAAPWHEAARAAGICAVAAYPFRENGAVAGALLVYAEESGIFGTAILPTLDEMTTVISFALDSYLRETARDRAEQDMRNALLYSELLLATSPVGIIAYKATGAAVSANEAAADIIGGSVGQLKAQNFHELESWKKSGLLTMAEHALATNSMTAGEVHFAPTTFGMDRWIQTRLVPFTHRSEKHLLGLLLDVTAIKLHEEQIRNYATQIERTFQQTVEMVMTLNDMRDPYTSGHERRVADIAVAIGAKLGLDGRETEGLRIAGFLHDIGKISIPAEILSKPSMLSIHEYALVKEHAQAGFDILKNVDFPWPVAQVALQHHERIDGSGYPNGLKGDAIMLGARIIAVADVIEAMATHRPYRPALGIDKALAEIERGRGSAYDSAVADACLKLFREKAFRMPGTNP